MDFYLFCVTSYIVLFRISNVVVQLFVREIYVIVWMKSDMEKRMENLEGQMTHAIEEFTGKIEGVEETVQDLRREVDKLQEMSVKPTLVQMLVPTSNLKFTILPRDSFTRSSSRLPRRQQLDIESQSHRLSFVTQRRCPAGFGNIWRWGLGTNTWSQRSNETLQQYVADIACLVYLAFPTASPKDIRERMAVRAFVRALKDCDTEQALGLDRCQTLRDALAYALEFEVSRGVE